MTDPFVGQLTFFRVYSGVLHVGSSVLNATKGKTERIGRLLKMHANKREEIKEVYAGDIAAAVGLKSVTTGDTLCDEKQPIVLESMDFPEPVISLAIEPKTKADQEKLGQGMQKLMHGRPDVPGQHRRADRAGRSSRGMGELHLEIIVDRLKREFSVDAKRRQAAGRLQGDADAAGRRRDEVREADRRPRPVRPREDPPVSRRAGHGLRVRERDRRRRDPEGVHQAGRRGDQGSAHARRAGRLPDRRRADRALRRLVSTTSTRRRWRSRSPARWRSRTPRRRRSPCCSSR